MIKIAKYLGLFLLLAVPLLLSSFRVEGFFDRISGPGDRIKEYYELREIKKVSSRIHELRASRNPDADLEVINMIETGVIEGQNTSLALYALGEMRSARSVETIVRVLRQNDNREHDTHVPVSGAEALAKIGGPRAQEALQEFYELSQRSDPQYWYLKVSGADKALKKALDETTSPNQAL